MRFTEQKVFTFNPTLFTRPDTQVALRIHLEYVTKGAGVPLPKFLEVDRGPGTFDPLWHIPVGNRTKFSRSLELPALWYFENPDWRLTKLGMTQVRKDRFHIAHLTLKEFDYFPTRGDVVCRAGIRHTIESVTIPPDAYWQQTGVWLGLVCECITAPLGDAQPGEDPLEVLPAEGPTKVVVAQVPGFPNPNV